MRGKNELLIKARESALSAISTFNSPQINFKSETFIVLMVIAWTYAFHAFYRSIKIDYRYRKNGTKRFQKTAKGAIKHWELEACLNRQENPLSVDATNNLKLLIGIRHEIEHQMTNSIDTLLSARFQSCAMNFNDFIKKEFGEKYGLDNHISFSIQFSQLTPKQFKPISDKDIPENLKMAIMDFESELTPEQLNNPQYSYSMVFVRKLEKKAGDNTEVVEFVNSNTELEKNMNKAFVVFKHNEKPKFKPKTILEYLHAQGYSKFSMHDHTMLWKANTARDPNKNFGVDIAGSFYWYESWKQFCLKYCQDNGGLYQPD